jgi:hypothetical protein
METVYRIFMYLFPFAISIALYIWMFRKAQRVPHKTLKGVALAIVIAGFCYTLYDIVKTIGRIFTDDRFHFEIMIVTVIVLFFASIVMALGEPEK